MQSLQSIQNLFHTKSKSTLQISFLLGDALKILLRQCLFNHCYRKNRDFIEITQVTQQSGENSYMVVGHVACQDHRHLL